MEALRRELCCVASKQLGRARFGENGQHQEQLCMVRCESPAAQPAGFAPTIDRHRNRWRCSVGGSQAAARSLPKLAPHSAPDTSDAIRCASQQADSRTLDRPASSSIGSVASDWVRLWMGGGAKIGAVAARSDDPPSLHRATRDRAGTPADACAGWVVQDCAATGWGSKSETRHGHACAYWVVQDCASTSQRMGTAT